MLLLLNLKMHPNRFVHCEVPTKRQIFARTGGASVSPNGVYTGDESARMNRFPTESAEDFVRAAESMKEDLPE